MNQNGCPGEIEKKIAEECATWGQNSIWFAILSVLLAGACAYGFDKLSGAVAVFSLIAGIGCLLMTGFWVVMSISVFTMGHDLLAAATKKIGES